MSECKRKVLYYMATVWVPTGRFACTFSVLAILREGSSVYGGHLRPLPRCDVGRVGGQGGDQQDALVQHVVVLEVDHLGRRRPASLDGLLVGGVDVP